MSKLIDIADAIVASLNGVLFDPPFEAARVYQPNFTLPELQTVQVSVVPKSIVITNASRAESQFEYAIDVGVQQKIDGEASVDDLMALVEAIVDHLQRKAMADATWVSISNEPVFGEQNLDEQRVFISVVTVTYRDRR
jgi:hypothetical protein